MARSRDGGGAAAAAAAADAAVASAADAADVRARRLRAGADTLLKTSSSSLSSSRGGAGGDGLSGAAAAYVHETDLRLAVVAEGWRAAATRRGHQFAARLRVRRVAGGEKAASRRRRRRRRDDDDEDEDDEDDHHHRVNLLQLPLPLAAASLISTPSQLEAELERLCRDFGLDAGLTRHSLAAHVRRLFVDVFAAQEARARPTPWEAGTSPSRTF